MRSNNAGESPISLLIYKDVLYKCPVHSDIPLDRLAFNSLRLAFRRILEASGTCVHDFAKSSKEAVMQHGAIEALVFS